MSAILRAASICVAMALGSGVLAQTVPNSWTSEWGNTDFSKASVNFSEIMSGGPPKDGIPALDGASFAPAADHFAIPDREPVITVELDGETARAYPIRYLTWHEIVNDRIGDRPVTVTFCPLCNSAIVFDGRLNGAQFTFGVSGKLRNSDMVMYDRNTESWWQQFTGEAIVGELTGTKLTMLPSWMESFADFKARHPDGLVMQEPNARRPYGENPYVGYDGSRTPFLYRGENPPHGIAPLARVVRVGDMAWPLARLTEKGEVEEAGLRLVWASGTASALDQRSIAASRDVGSIKVYDAETGKPVVHDVTFAFAFHAFEPEGIWHLGPGG